MGSINVKPSRTRDVIDVAGFYAGQDAARTDMGLDAINPHNTPQKRRLNRRERRTEKAKMRRLKLL